MRNRDPKKKQKGQESTIGKIIYSFLLFLPLIAISVTSLISTFNMSSKEETEITYKYKTNEVNSTNDLIEGRIYHFTFNMSNLNANDIICDCYNIYNLTATSFFDVNDLVGNTLTILKRDDTSIRINNNSNLQSIVYNISNSLVSCDVVFKSLSSNDSYLNYSVSSFNIIENVETHNLNAQDVFYDSITKIQQSPLFNWAENSIIYTTTASTCTALSITTPFIPLLMSYWLIISVIYFLYDIALMLVWIIHRKIHELQESI